VQLLQEYTQSNHYVLDAFKAPISHMLKQIYVIKEQTRKSKTEAVLQRRSMLKLGVIIHEALWKVLYAMKCSLGVPSVMLGRNILSVYFRYTGRVRNFGYFLQFVW